MSPQSILIGQIVLVFTTIILTTWYATQWVALQFDYDAYLGAPWFTVSRLQKSTFLGDCSSGGIPLMLMRRACLPKAGRLLRAVVSLEHCLLLQVPFGAGGRPRS